MNGRQPLSVGLEIVQCEDDSNSECVGQDLKLFACANSFSFGLLPLRKPRNSFPLNILNAGEPFQPQDMTLSTEVDSSFFVGCISGSLNPCSQDPLVRNYSEILIRQECQWAAFMGFSAVLFPPPLPLYDEHLPTKLVANYARCVSTALEMMHYGQVWVRIPVSVEAVENPQTSWQVWNVIRSLCRHHQRLKIALEIHHSVEDVSGWFSDPIACIILPTETFIPNKQGFPVLRRSHQKFLKRFMEDGVQVVVSTQKKSERLYASAAINAYGQYLQHMYSTLPELSAADQLVSGYDDYLQAPLQPLMDHLESATYEVFEQDPVKYQQYEKAVYRALLDQPAGAITYVETKLHNTYFERVIMVVGAGRGPLVANCLSAANNAKRMIKLYAVEKNPNAVVVLRDKNARIWNGAVTIIHSDMRYWDAPEKADILVSELLGSFGDNELSPECLDGAQKFLKENGISIPCKYTSYIAPLSSSKLYHEIMQLSNGDSGPPSKPWETSYVVKVKRAVQLADPQPLFTFIHPNREPTNEIRSGSPLFNLHNARYDIKTFEVSSQGAVMHGFVGYFDAVLYKDVLLSIHPESHSPGMFSWFPIFFPLKSPLFVSKNSSVDIHVWRLTDTTKVWYEWSVVPYVSNTAMAGGSSGIHNPGGRSFWIGLH